MKANISQTKNGILQIQLGRTLIQIGILKKFFDDKKAFVRIVEIDRDSNDPEIAVFQEKSHGFLSRKAVKEMTRIAIELDDQLDKIPEKPQFKQR